MKKLTKVLGALLCAMALVGCANPAGGTTDNKNSQKQDNASKLVKPEGVTITPNSKSVTKYDEALPIMQEIIMRTSVLDGEMLNAIKDTEEYATTQATALEAFDDMEAENQKIIDKAITDKKPYDVTNVLTYNPCVYNLSDNNGTYEIISRVEKVRKLGEYKDQSFVTNNIDIEEYKSKITVLDASKLKISEDNKNFKKGIISYIDEHSSTNVPTDTPKNTESIEDYNLSVMFDFINFSGIFTMQGTINTKAKTYSDASIKFYDINGELKYSLSDAELKTLFDSMLNPPEL